MYNPDNPDIRDRIELILSKQRAGPSGTIKLKFLPSEMRFEEV